MLKAHKKKQPPHSNINIGYNCLFLIRLNNINIFQHLINKISDWSDVKMAAVWTGLA